MDDILPSIDEGWGFIIDPVVHIVPVIEHDANREAIRIEDIPLTLTIKVTVYTLLENTEYDPAEMSSLEAAATSVHPDSRTLQMTIGTFGTEEGVVRDALAELAIDDYFAKEHVLIKIRRWMVTWKNSVDVTGSEEIRSVLLQVNVKTFFEHVSDSDSDEEIRDQAEVGRLLDLRIDEGLPEDANRDLIRAAEHFATAIAIWGAQHILQPATEEQISGIEHAEATGVTECCICMTEHEIGEVVARMPCGHQYHDECIIGWLRVRNKCPLCCRPLP